MRSRFGLGGLLSAAVLSASILGFASAAQALVVVDQDTFQAGPATDGAFTGMLPTGFPVHQTHLQTFTVGVAGTLSRLDLKIDNRSGSGLMELLIFNNGWLGEGVSAGAYVSAIRRTFANPAASDPYLLSSFDLSGANFAVTVGQVLSFSVRSAEVYGVINAVTLARTATNYAGGKDYISSNIGLRYLDYGTPDIQFQTYVENGLAAPPSPTAVPEPATWALMIGGFGLAGATLRRRTKPLLAR